MSTNLQPKRILVIEDDAQIRELIARVIIGMDLYPLQESTVDVGLKNAAANKPDLVILDLGLTDGDGIEFINGYRAWSSNPILVLSARIAEHEKVKALDAGADDYLTKPFGTAELMARVRVLLRRQHKVESNTPKFIFGDIEVDLSCRKVSKANEEIHLSKTEYQLLSLLLLNQGRVVTHRQLLKEVWGEQHTEDSHYLRIYMGHLRQKLEDDPAQPKYLLTETGIGYRLDI